MTHHRPDTRWTGPGPGNPPTPPPHHALILCANYTDTTWEEHWEAVNPTIPNPALLSIPIRTGNDANSRYWHLLVAEAGNPAVALLPEGKVRHTISTWSATGTIWTMYDTSFTAEEFRALLLTAQLNPEALTVEAALIAPHVPSGRKPGLTEGSVLRDWLFDRIHCAARPQP